MTSSVKDNKELGENPALFFEREIKQYIASSPNNVMPGYHGEKIWDEPLIGFADAEDDIFQEYKKIIGDFHVTPREALEVHLKKTACGYYHPEKISVVSWILPSTEKTRQSMRQETKVCSLLWNYTRWYGQRLNFRLARHLVAKMEGMGFSAVAPELENWWTVRGDVANAPASRWSQRHIAYAAGLGTFSLSDGLITARGISIRAGSIVCDIEIPPTPRTSPDHLANCLFYRNDDCGKCIARCPAGAISEKGHDKIKCRHYLNSEMPQILEELARGQTYVGSYPGCGLCQTNVPCESCIPAKSSKD